MHMNQEKKSDKILKDKKARKETSSSNKRNLEHKQSYEMIQIKHITGDFSHLAPITAN